MLANMGQVMAIMRVYGNDVTAMMRMMRRRCTAGNDERAHSKRRLNTQGVECGQRKGKTAKPTTNQIPIYWIWFLNLAYGNSEMLMASVRRG